jgi:MFS transporter, SP family, galactose:H+ symporter
MNREQFSGYALLLVFFAGLGGFLFGYNTGVISGALMYVSKDLSLSISQEGTIVSIILIGGLVGASAGGAMADRLGRRNTIILTAVLFVIGIWIVVLSHSLTILLTGRFITGVAVGITSVTAPLYLAEIAPPHNRGAFVCIHQFAISVGILVAYAINYLFSTQGAWRWMFGIGMAPAIFQFCGMLFLPESPSWLMANGHTEKAYGVLKRIRKRTSWVKHLPEMKHVAYSHKKSGWKDLFSKTMKKALIVGLGLSIFQIITGINTIVYYAPRILQSSSSASSATSALLATIILGVVNVIVSGVAVFLLDRQGRRRLLLIGTAGMTIGLVLMVLSLFLSFPNAETIKFISLIIYVFFFALSLGPVTWVVISEIYPLHIRGRAMSVAIFVNWLANYLVSLFFPDSVRVLSMGGTFLIFAVISFLAIWFVYRYVPETKNKSLEQIEESLR